VARVQLARRLNRARDVRGGGFRYALYRSYVLLVLLPIEPITEHTSDQFPLGKAQRIDGEAYESPALPLSYSAAAAKITERDPERQPRPKSAYLSNST
jgi:hypothetical protein